MSGSSTAGAFAGHGAQAGAAPEGGRSSGGSAGQGTGGSSEGGSGAGGGGSAGVAGTGGSVSGVAGTETAGGGGDSAGAAGSAGVGGNAGGTAGSGGANGDRCDVAVYDAAKPPTTLNLSGNLGTHDPVLIEANGSYYAFATGARIARKTSKDMLNWQNKPDAFNVFPAWIAGKVPGANNLWAPDISFFGGKYHLYYSASSFGSNKSCIGHATTENLETGTFTDHGPVICSNDGSNDNWNAIDPNLVLDEAGAPWLALGSFWGGLKLVALDADGARKGTSIVSLAARPQNGGALEAPFIVRRCGYYYLFTSWDNCCKGASSNYNIRVGRSEALAGPYVDRDGKAMMDGGGTLVLAGAGRWHGPGHNAVVFGKNAAYNVYHSYDDQANGASMLRISQLVWDNGWPRSGGP